MRYTKKMVSLALLRGVNVGGKAMISMAALRACLEELQLQDVQTFINSGNLLLRSAETDRAVLTQKIETALEVNFRLSVRVLLKTRGELLSLAAAIPDTWVNDTDTKCDVMFLWPEIDSPQVLDELPNNPDIEQTRYESGAVLWHIDRKLVSKSRMTRIIGTRLYHQMTVRNVNTVRKLAALAEAYDK